MNHLRKNINRFGKDKFMEKLLTLTTRATIALQTKCFLKTHTQKNN